MQRVMSGTGDWWPARYSTALPSTTRLAALLLVVKWSAVSAAPTSPKTAAITVRAVRRLPLNSSEPLRADSLQAKTTSPRIAQTSEACEASAAKKPAVPATRSIVAN